MMKISDLLAKTCRRTKTIAIDGLPPLTLHELTASERWALVDEIAKGLESNAAITGIVIKALTGYERDPTDEEISKFSDCYGHEVIDLLFEELMKFSAVNKEAVAEAKKN